MPGYYKAVLNALGATVVLCTGCAEQQEPHVIVSSREFNIHLPLTTDGKGIVIPTYWGNGKKAVMLNLDNHSPTWANNVIIEGNTAISKSDHFLYSSSTADGQPIHGDVYICDSILIGNIAFKNVAFYNISNQTNAGRPEGVIGENIMCKGIWKIDFKNRQVQFASSPDSIQGWQESERLPAAFTGKAVEITTGFGNGTTRKLELDLGYNGFVIVPAGDFAVITNGNPTIHKDSVRFSTPASATIVENTIAFDSVCMGIQCPGTLVTTNRLVKEPLVGLRFFHQFSFIILDYVHHTLHVSKERLQTLQE